MATPPTDAELDRLRALQRVLQQAVQHPAGLEGIEAAQRERFRALQVSPDDGEVLAGQSSKRLRVYRKLIRGTLHSAIGNELPKLKHRLGDARFDRYFRAFVETVLPTSRVLRDVAYEFAMWAHPVLVADDEVADFVPDLMRFELFEFDVYTGQRVLEPDVPVSDELAADKPVAFDGTVRIARFDHHVHRLVDRIDNDAVPKAGEVGVLAYRDADNRYRQLDLTPLATSILSAMVLDGQPLAAAVQGACAAHGVAITPKVIEGTSEVLADLGERGAIRGARSHPGPPAPASPYFRWLFAPPDE